MFPDDFPIQTSLLVSHAPASSGMVVLRHAKQPVHRRSTALRLVGNRPGVSDGGQDKNFIPWPLHGATVDGRNPAPLNRLFIPFFIGFLPSQVVQDFFHPL